MNYQRHPLSESWPDMEKEDFQALEDSIGYSGLLEPITLFEGKILDGWHRYNACINAEMALRFHEFMGDDPAQYVRDKHTRRPLTLTQRLTCIALMARWRPNGGKQSAVPADCSTSKDIAKAAGGGIRSAEQVKEAITKGSPELVQAMKSGKVGAEKAAAIAKMPQAEQAAAIHKPLPKPVAVVEPEPEAPAEYTELDAMREQISDLQSELVVARMGDIPEEEKQQASTRLAELQAEVKTLSATLKAAYLSRDSLLEENAQMKRQMAMQRKEIEKLKSNN